MRADDDEVKWFYDLLGWAIVDARAKAGDEEYLAFLCNARTLFCKVYEFLNPEDDLKKIKKRIDVVKEQIANGKNPFGDEKKYSVISNRYLRSTRRMHGGSKLTMKKSGEIEKSPKVILEDLLMQADWKLKQKDYKTAGTNYYLALMIATGKFANLEYDGTAAQNAAKMGMIYINPQIQQSNNPIFDLDSSFRSAELTLKLYCQATNDEQRAEYDTEAALNILPKANKMILALYEDKAILFIQKRKFGTALDYFKRYYQYLPIMPLELASMWIDIYITKGNTEKAFNTGMIILKYPQCFNRALIRKCDLIWSWANVNDIKKYSIIRKSIEILPALLETRPGLNINRLSKALNWKRKYGEKELLLREKIDAGNYEYALKIITNDLSENIQAGHLYQMAKIYAFLGMTNQAYYAVMKSYKKRCKLAQKVGGDNIQYPIIESSLIESIFIDLNNKNCDEYINWLKNRMEECIEQNKFADANLADKKIKNLKIKLKTRHRK